jgi:hypothetical protein
VFKLRPLGICYWTLILFETIPKLCDLRKALGRRQAHNFIWRQQFHLS